MSCLASFLSHRRRLLLSILLLAAGVRPAQAADVHLQWDPNAEPDLAGYVVLVGTASGVYTQSIEVGPATPHAAVSGLPEGAIYFFAVRAINTGGLQSGLSNEVSVTLGTIPGPTPAPAPTISGVSPASGPVAGGAAVTISGSNFAEGRTVRFGTTVAAVTSASPSSLVAIAPPGSAGPVAVTVANPDGQAATRSGAFTYVAPAVAVTGFAPTSGPTAGGTQVTITGSNFSPGPVVRFGTTPATVVSASSTSIVVRTPPLPPGGVPVTVMLTDGRTATAAGTFTVVAPAPIISTVDPAWGSTAGGTLVTITGSQFLEGASVLFGTVPATVASVTSTTITAVAPAQAAGLVGVTVANPGGGIATKAAWYSYEAPKEPAAFVRYFAEGAQGGFFDTRFALANPHAIPVSVQATFTDVFGQESRMDVEVPAGSRVTVDRTNMPALASDAFASKFESSLELGIDRTVVWDNGTPYGAHSETGIASPRTVWYFAEGATHSGFDLFYLLQNPADTAAEVLVRYMLGTGEVVEKVHVVGARARTNIWVNHDDRALASAEVSAQLVSLNGVPIVAERSMYQNTEGQLFTAGHNSGGIAEPATRWFLAEGATGDYFDTFVLVANPNPTAATLLVTYLLPDAAPLRATYTVAPNSRFTIWADHEHPRLKKTDLSVIVASTNGVPVIVERTMWWPGRTGGRWTEAHNSAGATTTSPQWVLADGFSSDANGDTTYALVANTGDKRTRVRFTLLTARGPGRTVEAPVRANSRFSLDVAETFPEAANTTFGLLVESMDGAPLVVERASYWNAGGVHWAAGTNSLASPVGQPRPSTTATQ